nr:conserved hypothetical protein [uncultured bacterium]
MPTEGKVMPRLKLTDTERLILANQYEILAALKNDDSYGRIAGELRDGQEWLYQQHFDYFSPNMQEEDAEFVVTIVGIYSDLRDSYERLADKSGIEPHQVEFPGFDGNNEGELPSFARALRKSNRFIDTLPEHGKDSHMPTRDIYSRMISKWEELGKPHFPLSKEQISALLAARAHPSNR